MSAVMTGGLTIGFVCSRVRKEEKLLLEELERRRGVRTLRFDDDELQLSVAGTPTWPELDKRLRGCDAVWLRGISQTRTQCLAALMGAWGVPTVNRADVIAACDDKLVTTARLQAAGVPTPRTAVAFTAEAAVECMEAIGYPCVLKPVNGSWGRLLARINDRDAAEAVVEHREVLGGPQHGVFYIQEHVAKPGRDIRAFFIGDATVCAVYRNSEHWVTNTARGAQAQACPVTDEIDHLCRTAAAALGGGALAIDLLESSRGILVNEVNATMEFRNSIDPTGVDIPALLTDHVLAVAAGAPA
ncbi:MAG: lysine biosynthesis protein LysX [Candidatus Dormibacteria bacterium]